MNVVEINNLSKVYRRRKALDKLSLTIKADTITGVIGRNGAGKTTLLKLIAGYLKESTGKINVFSKRPFNNLFVSSQSVFIDDIMYFPESLTLKELLIEGERFYENWDMTFAKALFDYFSFDPNSIHDHLSKGKQSTFNMIFGLSTRAPLTIFDEPTTGMDVSVRKDFYRVLLKDYLAYPRTILLSSHHLDEIEHLLENVLLIDQGRHLLHLPIDDLKEYAVGMTGEKTKVEELIQGKQIIYKENTDSNMMFVVMKRNIDPQVLKQVGISVKPIRPSDLCVYLTKDSKGGIDDVLKYD